MITTLRFRLPKERADLQAALKAQALASALRALEDRLRSLRKYGLPDDVKKKNHAQWVIESLSDLLHDEISDAGLREVLDE